MSHPPADQSRIIRCAAGRWHLGIGAFFAVLGLASCVFAVVSGVTGDIGQLVLLIPMALVFGIGGVLMCLLGRNMWARLDRDGITWRTLSGKSTAVGWRAVHHVEIPATGHGGRCVQLVQFNGNRIDVKTITKLPAFRGRAVADASYLAAGQEIINAHRAWLARQR